MTTKIFKSLSRTLTRSKITSIDVVITLDGVDVPTRAIFTRRANPIDRERQVFVTSAPAMAFYPSMLPRKPKQSDVVVDDEGKAWKINGQPEDYGAGMLEYPLARA